MNTPTNPYIPFFAQLVRALQDHCGPGELDQVMSAVGRRLAAAGRFDEGPFAKRLAGAAALLDDIGGPCTIQSLAGGFIVSGGGGCVLAAAGGGRAAVCCAMKSVITELVQVPVRERCERGDQSARCCFEIGLVVKDALEQRANPITDASSQ